MITARKHSLIFQLVSHLGVACIWLMAKNMSKLK